MSPTPSSPEPPPSLEEQVQAEKEQLRAHLMILRKTEKAADIAQLIKSRQASDKKRGSEQIRRRMKTRATRYLSESEIKQAVLEEDPPNKLRDSG